jgi:hypothetical protein
MRRSPSFGCVLALACTSCFAVTNLDRFQKSTGPTGNFSDLRLTVRGMTSHVAEYFEYRIVDASNTIQSRGIVLPLGGPDATVFAPGAIPHQNGPFRLDFYADHDHNGSYTLPLSDGTFPDHGWRIPLPEPNDQNLVEVIFDHNTSFSNLSDPAAPSEYGKVAIVKLNNLDALQGKRIEVRIADASAKRVVALYRVPVLSATSVSAAVPGMIEEGVTYSIEVYTDDGAATPASIVAYRFTKDSDAGGLVTDFDPATAPKVTDAPPP